MQSIAAPLDPPFELPVQAELNKLRSAIAYTSKGNIEIELYPDIAPWHVANLKYLADKGFYKDLKFHLYEPGYFIQTGDPTGKGLGGPGYFLPPEFNREKHKIGSVGMARANDFDNPERRSHGSQFYIILGDAPHMDGQYTIFGRVIKGLDIARSLKLGDDLIDFRVFVRPSGTAR